MSPSINSQDEHPNVFVGMAVKSLCRRRIDLERRRDALEDEAAGWLRSLQDERDNKLRAHRRRRLAEASHELGVVTAWLLDAEAALRLRKPTAITGRGRPLPTNRQAVPA